MVSENLKQEIDGFILKTAYFGCLRYGVRIIPLHCPDVPGMVPDVTEICSPPNLNFRLYCRSI